VEVLDNFVFWGIFVVLIICGCRNRLSLYCLTTMKKAVEVIEVDFVAVEVAGSADEAVEDLGNVAEITGVLIDLL